MGRNEGILALPSVGKRGVEYKSSIQIFLFF